jgi:hypothetical protein
VQEIIITMSRSASYTLKMQQSYIRLSPDTYCRTLIIHPNVTIIQPGACSNCIYLESVVIPPSVIEIRQNAFRYCEVLGLVELSEGLKCIESGAFGGCALNHIRIPSSVEEIHEWAFDTRSMGSYARDVTVEFCEQIEAFVTEVSLRGWWNRLRNRKDVFLTYSWMTKNSIPQRLDTIHVIEWKHEIHNMLRCIGKPARWVWTQTLDGHFRSIESNIASYEVLNGSVPSLDVAIMTHIFSYIKAVSSDSNHDGGGGGEELGNESDDTSSEEGGEELENESDDKGNNNSDNSRE